VCTDQHAQQTRSLLPLVNCCPLTAGCCSPPPHASTTHASTTHAPARAPVPAPAPAPGCTSDGLAALRQLSVMVALIARDVAAELPHVLRNVERLGALLGQVRPAWWLAGSWWMAMVGEPMAGRPAAS